MNIKLNRISYSALFSGLGVFSFFLLANYAELSDRVSDALYSVGMFLFFILAFNLLGYSTIRLTTWVDNQYSVNIHRRWKLIFIYTMVMLMFFLLNYGLLVTAKFLVGASHPFVFPNGGGYLDISLVGGTGDFRFAACQPFYAAYPQIAETGGCFAGRK